MLNGVSKKIEVVANVAIVVVACLLIVVLIKNHFLVASPRPASPADVASKKPETNQRANAADVSSLNINWKQNGQTLILAISNTCHFCTESAPFYKKLAQARGNSHLVAVLPQSIEDGRRYLDKLGVTVDEVRQVPLDRIGVQGTPTLILIDDSGVIKNSWVGLLPAEAELGVLKALRGA
jgi:thioredoxin-related protein